jgi:hypothetical protein
MHIRFRHADIDDLCQVFRQRQVSKSLHEQQGYGKYDQQHIRFQVAS